jgi:hypothetical protein
VNGAPFVESTTFDDIPLGTATFVIKDSDGTPSVVIGAVELLPIPPVTAQFDVRPSLQGKVRLFTQFIQSPTLFLSRKSRFGFFNLCVSCRILEVVRSDL